MRTPRHPLGIALLVGLTAAAPLSAQGGLLGGLKKRAADAVEQKATQKVNQKIDEAAEKLVNKSFDSMFGGGSDKGGGGSSGGGRFGGFSLLPNAPTEPFYEFDASLVYEIESMPKGKPASDVALLTMLTNKNGKYTGAKLASENRQKDDGELFAIFDMINESMVMLVTSEKEKVSMAYSWKGAKQYEATQSAPPPARDANGSVTVVNPEGKPITFSYLGKRKIAGYNAEGFKAVGETGDAEVWVTQETGLPSNRPIGPVGSMRQMRGVVPESYPTGLLLEVISTDSKTGDKGRMTVRSIDTKSKLKIDMSEYKKAGAAK